MISGVQGRGLESWGHLSLQGERRSNSNETNLPTPRRHSPPFTLSTPPSASFSLVQTPFFSLNHFSPSPTALYLHFPPYSVYHCALPCLRLCLPVVNPITIYYCLLPLAKARTNAIVVGDSLAFRDKQRFMSSLFIFFSHGCRSADVMLMDGLHCNTTRHNDGICCRFLIYCCLNFTNEAGILCSFSAKATIIYGI